MKDIFFRFDESGYLYCEIESLIEYCMDHVSDADLDTRSRQFFLNMADVLGELRTEITVKAASGKIQN